MIKVYINNEEVLCDKNIVIKKEMLNTSSTILNNVYPKSWETTHDYTTNYYYPLDYSNCKIIDERDIPAEEGQTIEGTTFEINADLTKEYSFDSFKGNTTQEGTPTPSNPVNVNVVTGGQDIVVCGKNLYDATTEEQTTYGVTNSADNQCLYINGTRTSNSGFNFKRTFLKAGTYKLMLEMVSGTIETQSNGALFYVYSPTNGVLTRSPNYITLTNTNYKASMTLTLTEDAEVYIHNWQRTTETFDNTIIKYQIVKGNEDDYDFEAYNGNTYEINLGDIELCKIGNYQDRIYKDSGKWYLEKQIGKVVLDGSENWAIWRTNTFYSYFNEAMANEMCYCSHFVKVNQNQTLTNGITFVSAGGGVQINIYPKQDFIDNYGTLEGFKNWLGTHNTIVYYVLNTPTTTEITDTELINQLESIELINGLNNISSSGNLPVIMELHYNYVTPRVENTLLFSGIVKNTGNISLNPREPHYASIEVLGYECFLSESDTLDFVIADKTITEAINMVIEAVSSYGVTLGTINIKNPNDIIGAYSCEDKTAYDVLQYLAEISEARWTTTIVDEDTIQVDFYDPDLVSSSATIEYTQNYFRNNKIIDMEYNFGTRDYRNKQVINSNAVYADIQTTETIYCDGYNTSYNLENRIGNITSVTINGVEASYVTREEYDNGYSGDLIYEYGSNTITLENTQTAATPVVIIYTAIVKGRETVTNDSEITRVNSQLNVNGIISRYEDRDDITSSDELLQIANTYMKYKGSTEITLTIQNQDIDLFDIGQIVKFQNAPLEELETTYIVKAKEIDYIATTTNLFYTYTLTSNFNSENAINYFDNQRNKRNGNIATGSFIDRSIDLFSTANIIWRNASIQEVQITGDNGLNSTLNSPFVV